MTPRALVALAVLLPVLVVAAGFCWQPATPPPDPAPTPTRAVRLLPTSTAIPTRTPAPTVTPREALLAPTRTPVPMLVLPETSEPTRTPPPMLILPDDTPTPAVGTRVPTQKG